MNKFNQARSQGGFSLIELLLVLAIVAALAVAAFIVYPRVQAGRNAGYEAQVLSAAVAGAKAIFVSGNYTTLDNTVANNAELFPTSMINGADGIVNQWEGAVVIEGTDAAGADTGAVRRYITITYPEVPRDVCMRLGASAAQNFGRVAVGGDTPTVIIDTFDNVETNNVVDEAALTSSCGNGPNTMVFTTN